MKTLNETSPCRITCGDSVDELRELNELNPESVDLFVTSPPYGDLRTYEGCAWDFEGTAKEMYKALKPGGAVCWVVGDSVVDGSETLDSSKQKIFFVEKCGFRIHDTMIYQKRNFSNPERVRYHQVFEYVIVLSKGKFKTFNPIMDRKNIAAGKIGSLGANTVTGRNGSKLVRPRKMNKEFGMRHNVWKGNTRGQEEMCVKLKHPAMMPKWLARDLTISFSNPGDLVGDPFCGVGTTGIEAIKLGRKVWMNDSSDNYVSIATQDAVKAFNEIQK